MSIDHYKQYNECFHANVEQVGLLITLENTVQPYFMNHFIYSKSGVSVPAKLQMTNDGTVASGSHEVRIYDQPLTFVQK